MEFICYINGYKWVMQWGDIEVIAIESEAGNMEGHMGFLLYSNQRLGRIWHWWFKKNHGRHMGGQKAFAKLEATCSTWEAMLLLLKARGIHQL